MTKGKTRIVVTRPQKSEKTRTISFRTTDEIAGLIEAVALKNHRTMSQQICVWVENGINL